jgi:hypothetical protein
MEVLSMNNIANTANNCQRRRTAISEKRALAANKHTETPQEEFSVPDILEEEELLEVIE